MLAGHLLALAVQVLAAPSGPWASNFGVGPATEPQFARSLCNVLAPLFLTPIKMADNYHDPANRPGSPSAYFEVLLKDRDGKALKTVRIPEEGANAWIRHRQTLLAQALTNDEPIEPRGGEVIAAPNQQATLVSFWEIADNRNLKLRTVPEHLVPRDRQVFKPSAWSQTLARSYVRYLCRTHGAATGELIRHTREAIPPAMMYQDEAPQGAFEELASSFGETPR
jgi:hypothetical protein